MFGSLYNNPYSSSNPYAEPSSNLLAGTLPGQDPLSKYGEDDLLSFNTVFSILLIPIE